MCVAPECRKVGVSKSLARPIEGVSVAVVAAGELNGNVGLLGPSHLRECQLGVLGPPLYINQRKCINLSKKYSMFCSTFSSL